MDEQDFKEISSTVPFESPALVAMLFLQPK